VTLIDTHAHLAAEEFDADREEALARAREAGVAGIVCVGDRLDSSRASLELAQSRTGLWATAGVHPHYAREAGDDLERRLEELLAHPLVVAVGEVGLDYHYDFSPRDVQQDVFRRQIRLARAVGKPLVIHNRESDQDLVRDPGGGEGGRRGRCPPLLLGRRGAGPRRFGDGVLPRGRGPVTFKKSDALRQTLQGVPVERLIVETDAPYLAPVPYRGKRNEPSYVVETAKQLAALKGLDLEELARITTENARRLFRIELNQTA